MPNKKKDLSYALMFLLTAFITLLKPNLIIVTVINFIFSICYFYIYYVDCEIERWIEKMRESEKEKTSDELKVITDGVTIGAGIKTIGRYSYFDIGDEEENNETKSNLKCSK